MTLGSTVPRCWSGVDPEFKVRLWLPQGSAETLPRLSDRLFAKDGVCIYMTARCCCRGTQFPQTRVLPEQ